MPTDLAAHPRLGRRARLCRLVLAIALLRLASHAFRLSIALADAADRLIRK